MKSMTFCNALSRNGAAIFVQQDRPLSTGYHDWVKWPAITDREFPVSVPLPEPVLEPARDRPKPVPDPAVIATRVIKTKIRTRLLLSTMLILTLCQAPGSPFHPGEMWSGPNDLGDSPLLQNAGDDLTTVGEPDVTILRLAAPAVGPESSGL